MFSGLAGISPQVLSASVSLLPLTPAKQAGDWAPRPPAKGAFPRGAGGREETRASICFLPNASCLQNPLGRAQAPQIRNTRETKVAEQGPEERSSTSLGRPVDSRAGPLVGSWPWLSPVPLPTPSITEPSRPAMKMPGEALNREWVRNSSNHLGPGRRRGGCWKQEEEQSWCPHPSPCAKEGPPGDLLRAAGSRDLKHGL